MEIDPDSLTIAERSKLLVGAIVPRPIALVSTIAPDGSSLNLAPYSFFNGVGTNPMTLLFCPANKADGSEKDSLRNCKPAAEGGQGQFVVSVVTEALAERMAASAAELPYGTSEFPFAGLTPAASARVRPPRVLESPVSYECETIHVYRTGPVGPGGGEHTGNVVVGRVVHVHVADGLIDARMRIDPDALHAVGRMAGTTYARTRDRFDISPGKVPAGG